MSISFPALGKSPCNDQNIWHSFWKPVPDASNFFSALVARYKIDIIAEPETALKTVFSSGVLLGDLCLSFRFSGYDEKHSAVVVGMFFGESFSLLFGNISILWKRPHEKRSWSKINSRLIGIYASPWRRVFWSFTAHLCPSPTLEDCVVRTGLGRPELTNYCYGLSQTGLSWLLVKRTSSWSQVLRWTSRKVSRFEWLWSVNLGASGLHVCIGLKRFKKIRGSHSVIMVQSNYSLQLLIWRKSFQQVWKMASSLISTTVFRFGLSYRKCSLQLEKSWSSSCIVVSFVLTGIQRRSLFP